MTIRNKLEEVLEYIIAICIIINANTVWGHIGLGKLNSIILSISLFILVFMSFKYTIKDKKNFLKISIMLIGICIFNTIFIFFNGQNVQRFIFNFVFILIFFIISSYNKKSNMLIKISNIMIILASISLIFYVFASCLNLISANSQIILEWGYERTVPSYYHLYYNTQSVSIGGSYILRNTGIFTEAPMYTFNLVIALISQIFLNKPKNKRNIAVLMITIFTTFSTTGIIVGLSIFILDYLINKSNSKIYLSIKILILPILIISSISIATFFVVSKINESTYRNASYSTRLDDFKVGFEAWEKNKIIGNGYERYDLTRAYMSTNDRAGDMGGSSGLMMVLPQGGIYLLTIYMIPLIVSLLYSIKNKKKDIFIMSIVITILFIVTSIPYTYMMIYFLSLGYSCVFRKKDNKYREII